MIGSVSRPFTAIAFGLLGACLVALLAAPRAEAGYPGQLGVIALDTDFGGLTNDEVSTMPITGGPPFTRLTFDVLGNAEDDNNPAYSGDGKKIVWEGDTDLMGSNADDEIFIMNADGTGQTPLTPILDDGDDDEDPAISWDGRRIVFERPNPSGGDDEIFIMNSDGSGQVPLTSNDSDETDPVFSRDGKLIYYEGEDAEGDSQIFVMNVDGSGQRQLTTAEGFSSDPDVSPDDRRIVFESNRANVADEIGNVWVMNADGSGQTKLTSFSTPLDITDRPVFSPDGKQILFDFEPDVGSDEIFVMNADGSGLRPLTTTPDDTVDNPDWQPIPVNCGGRQATLVGTAGADTLVGTAAADVIAGLGGKDKLSGLGAKDRLCGGKGKDTLKGGGGNDRLFGGAGKDKLKAGKGKKDTCSGGKGNDSGKGCEKEKSL
jgi:RTX calcium-binding nonapeptide repeat (4 copies)/WD40-like Beta Propeller Repeat